MNWLEKLSLTLVRLRIFLFLHPKGVLISLGIFLVGAAGSVVGIYFYQQAQEKTADVFYQTVLHDLASKDATNDKIAVLDTALPKAEKGFFQTYIYLKELDLLTQNQDPVKVQEFLKRAPTNVGDSNLNDLLYLRLAEAYRTLGKPADLEAAVSLLGKIRSRTMEEMQLFSLAKIYYTKKDFPQARNNLQSLLQKYPQTNFKPFVEAYMALLQP